MHYIFSLQRISILPHEIVKRPSGSGNFGKALTLVGRRKLAKETLLYTDGLGSGVDFRPFSQVRSSLTCLTRYRY